MLWWLFLATALPLASFTAPRSIRAEGLPLRIGYVDDAAERQERNDQRKNYWDAYLPELLDELGLRGDAISPGQLGDAATLSRYDTVLAGKIDAEQLWKDGWQTLRAWVERGGTLLLFGSRGFEELAGIVPQGTLPQGDSEFTSTATIQLGSGWATQGIHSTWSPHQRLLVFSDVVLASPGKADEVARLFDRDGRDTESAAITTRAIGQGRVYWFAFSLPQTIWVLHQGRPVDRDYDGDNLLRRSDAIVIRPHAIDVAYADELMLVLQNLIGWRPRIFVHALPPSAEGEIPDALFHWGGDDEGDSQGIQVVASDWMRAQGLPYHINAMPRADGTFGLSAADARRIIENGHELSIHFNFVDGFAEGTGFTRDQLISQDAAFKKVFGKPWVCSVNHWTRWTGWVEPVRWMRDAGGLADNSFIHCGSPPSNPTNRIGYSCGTAFPFWFYEDWSGSNRRIDFLELPITAYECGYDGQQAPDFETIHKVVDLAAQYHQTMNMFYHPIYIADFPHCRAAITEMLAYLQKKKIPAMHVGNDALCHWWRARSKVIVTPTASSPSQLTFDYECDNPTGFGWIAKVPVGRNVTRSATVDGKDARFRTEERFGQNWALVALPNGKRSAAITWSDKHVGHDSPSDHSL